MLLSEAVVFAMVFSLLYVNNCLVCFVFGVCLLLFVFVLNTTLVNVIFGLPDDNISARFFLLHSSSQSVNIS